MKNFDQNPTSEYTMGGRTSCFDLRGREKATPVEKKVNSKLLCLFKINGRSFGHSGVLTRNTNGYLRASAALESSRKILKKQGLILATSYYVLHWTGQ
jgi:hypothetical protein